MFCCISLKNSSASVKKLMPSAKKKQGTGRSHQRTSTRSGIVSLFFRIKIFIWLGNFPPGAQRVADGRFTTRIALTLTENESEDVYLLVSASVSLPFLAIRRKNKMSTDSYRFPSLFSLSVSLFL